MGTTLTGTTPQDTYDSLIKVTDNGPIGTSLKTLTDGLGNDSALGLSNRGLKVNQSATLITDTATLCHFTNNFFYVRGGTAGLVLGDDGLSNRIQFDDNGAVVFEAGSVERMRITSAGNVGIGTTAPAQKLSVVGGSIFTSRTDSSENIIISDGTVNSSIQQVSHLYLNSGTNSATFGDIILRTKNSFTEMARFTQNGLCFNGDTAAANALDDYEEGTWTMGISFGGGTTGVTYGANSGTYTKIGRQVTVTGYLLLSDKGTDTGNARVTGLPFTLGGANGNLSAASLYFENISFANQFMGFAIVGTTTCAMYEITEAGAYTVLNNTNFANNSAVIISLTYFV